MPFERIVAIKRTVFVAECSCGERKVLTDSAPRETLCKCGDWIKFVEQSYTGPEIAKEKTSRF